MRTEYAVQMQLRIDTRQWQLLVIGAQAGAGTASGDRGVEARFMYGGVECMRRSERARR